MPRATSSTEMAGDAASSIEKISYEALRISPYRMPPIESVLHEIDNDKYWKVDKEEPSEDLSILVFLYGKGIYKDLLHEERIRCMMCCITPVGGNRKRLKQLVHLNYNDRIMHSENGFKAYFRMASTARMLFEKNQARGGFPKEAYLRNQGNNSLSYIVAFCMFLTIKIQRDNPQLDIAPIDVGDLARHYVIDAREGLEDRVWRDRGGDAQKLAYAVLGEDTNITSIDCNLKQSNCDLQFLTDTMWPCLKKNGVGLVTNFRTSSNFKNVKHRKEFGYWKFDGDSLDSEGEFVIMEEDSKVSEEMKRLREKWEKQVKEAQQRKTERKYAMEGLTQVSPLKETGEVKNADGDVVHADISSIDLIRLTFKLDDTVREMKTKIASAFRCSADRLSLEFNGESLDDKPEDSLKSCGIGYKSIVYVAREEDAGVFAAAVSVVVSGREPMHAMVLLGCLDTDMHGQKRLYILWNSWPNMPLVAVSIGYLVACRCKILFFNDSLSPDCIDGLKRTEGLACDCAPVDHAEDTLATNWSTEDG